MQKSKYLPLGKILGGHYEIVEILGDDSFEILYLVKDTHRLENLFVIKELFLDAITFRDNNNLQTSDKAFPQFEESKTSLIEETKKLQKNNSTSLQTHGYFEENSTVYIIMEFKKNTDINNYFKASTSIKNKQTDKKKNKSFSIFTKILLIAVAIFIGLTLYTYKMIKDDKEHIKNRGITVEESNEPMYHPPLKERESATKENDKAIIITTSNNDKNNTLDKNKTRTVPEGAEYISAEEQLKRESADLLEEELREEQEANLSEELYDDGQIIPQDELNNYEEAMSIPIDSAPSLGTPIGNTEFSPF